MVKIAKSVLNSSLSYINNNSRTEKNEALVGQVADGSMRLWQPGAIKVWDSIPVEDSAPMFFTVPGEKLSKIVSSCTSDTISMTVKDDKKLNMSFGKSRIRMPMVISADEELKEPPEVENTLLVGPEFIDALNRATPFLARTEDRPLLTCYYISPLFSNVLRIVTADGTKIFMADIPYEGPQSFQSFLLPKDCGRLIGKSLSSAEMVSIGITRDGLLVISEVGSNKIICVAPYSGKYPDLSEMANKEEIPLFKVLKKDLHDMLSLVEITSDMKEIQFGIVEGSLAVYATKAQIETDLFLDRAEILNEFSNIYFTTGSFRDCITAAQDNEVIIGLVDKPRQSFSVSNGDRRKPYSFVQAISN